MDGGSVVRQKDKTEKEIIKEESKESEGLFSSLAVSS